MALCPFVGDPQLCLFYFVRNVGIGAYSKLGSIFCSILSGVLLFLQKLMAVIVVFEFERLLVRA